MVSEPNGYLYPFALYAGLILFFLIISCISISLFTKRLFLILPFLILTALLYPISFYIEGLAIDSALIKRALSIFFKAFLSVILILILFFTEDLYRLPKAMQQMGLPKIISLITDMMFRYIHILADELIRTSMARQSRTGHSLKHSKIKIYGNQIALVFLRSWERSKNVYSAMLARGYTGTYHCTEKTPLKTRDIFTLIGLLSLFVLIRFLNKMMF